MLAQELVLSPANTVIEFEIKHLSVLTVKGTFDEFNGSLTREEGSWVITGVIESASINTKNKNRDETLRTDAYFNVENYPEITFEGVGEESSQGLIITGVLKLKNLSSELTFRLLEEEKQLISEQIKISRKEIGLSFDSMDMLIGDEVTIQITIDETLR